MVRAPLFLSAIGSLACCVFASATSADYAFWRGQFWLGEAVESDAVSGPNADPDGDGRTNGLEFLMGSHPLERDGQAIEWRSVEGDLGELRYRARGNARDGRLGLEEAKGGGGAVVWTPVREGRLDRRGGIASMAQTLPVPLGDGSRLFRLRGEVDAEVAESEQPYVWWEAEEAAGSNAALSSGGLVWMNAFAKREWPDIQVTEPGRYTLWARKNWNHVPFECWLSDGDGTQIGERLELVGSDGGLDLRIYDGPGNRVEWVELGEWTLAAGRYRFHVEMGENAGSPGVATAFDCFLLIDGFFAPDGILKPGEVAAVEDEGWFAFAPGGDPFVESAIDLRWLNEERAGEAGYLRAEGDRLVLAGSGEPFRIWGVNAGHGILDMGRASLRYLARLLAKNGVNLVRIHGSMYRGSGDNWDAVDADRVDTIQYFVSVLKEEGIYSGLSIYFPLWVRIPASDERFPGYDGSRHPFAMPYFNPAFHAIYEEWWRSLLASPNPYGGVPLKDDPAIAYVELLNEDSLFFWTFTPYEQVPAEQMALLEKQFGDWLLERYETLDTALADWGGQALERDRFAEGRVGIRPLWEMANERTARDQATARFMAELQAAFYEKMGTYLREEIGTESLIVGSNWITADARRLGPLDKWSNVGFDLMDRHGYFEGEISSDDGSHAYDLREGHRFTNRSALRVEQGDAPADALGSPVFDLHYDRKPSIISEMDWSMPNRFRAEMPWLAAAYGSLQGSDGFVFFTLTGFTWQNTLSKWPLMSPATMGQFPAAALAYRQGYVEEAEYVAEFDLEREDLFALAGAPVSQPQNLDAIREDGVPPGGTLPDPDGVDPLAQLVGKVGIRFVDTGEGAERVVSLEGLVDREARVVRSATKELALDYGSGVLRIDTPFAQGLVGFLGSVGGAVELGDVSVASTMEYGTIVVVSLDGQAIGGSERLLLQAMSEARNNGWEAVPAGDGFRLSDYGGSPVTLRRIEGVVTLLGERFAEARVTALDQRGYRTERVWTGATVELAEDVVYYLVEL